MCPCHLKYHFVEARLTFALTGIPSCKKPVYLEVFRMLQVSKVGKSS